MAGNPRTITGDLVLVVAILLVAPVLRRHNAY